MRRDRHVAGDFFSVRYHCISLHFREFPHSPRSASGGWRRNKHMIQFWHSVASIEAVWPSNQRGLRQNWEWIVPPGDVSSMCCSKRGLGASPRLRMADYGSIAATRTDRYGLPWRMASQLPNGFERIIAHGLWACLTSCPRYLPATHYRRSDRRLVRSTDGGHVGAKAYADPLSRSSCGRALDRRHCEDRWRVALCHSTQICRTYRTSHMSGWCEEKSASSARKRLGLAYTCARRPRRRTQRSPHSASSSATFPPFHVDSTP